MHPELFAVNLPVNSSADDEILELQEVAEGYRKLQDHLLGLLCLVPAYDALEAEDEKGAELLEGRDFDTFQC